MKELSQNFFILRQLRCYIQRVNNGSFYGGQVGTLVPFTFLRKFGII